MDEKLLFNRLLNTELDKDLTNDNICLISYEKLENNYITLDCGHKFNYINLYKELVNQKTKKLFDNKYLKINEIKCPYCRQITPKLIPYYKYYELKCIRGVNYPPEFYINTEKCECILKNGIRCNEYGCKTNNGIYCNKHIKYLKHEEDVILSNTDDYKFYNKFNLIKLKEILSLNKCNKSGNKDKLIVRILNKKLNLDWIE